MTTIHCLQLQLPIKLVKTQQLSHVSYLCYWDIFISIITVFLNVYDMHIIFR